MSNFKGGEKRDLNDEEMEKLLRPLPHYDEARQLYGEFFPYIYGQTVPEWSATDSLMSVFSAQAEENPAWGKSSVAERARLFFTLSEPDAQRLSDVEELLDVDAAVDEILSPDKARREKIFGRPTWTWVLWDRYEKAMSTIVGDDASAKRKRALLHAALWQYHPTVVRALLRRLEKDSAR